MHLLPMMRILAFGSTHHLRIILLLQAQFRLAGWYLGWLGRLRIQSLFQGVVLVQTQHRCSPSYARAAKVGALLPRRMPWP